MTDSLLILFLFSGFRLSLPLIFAAIGGYFSERSGVAQISLEAFLLIGAFSAASIAVATDSLGLSLLGSGLFTALFAQIFCFLVIKLKSNAVVIGTGINLLAVGLIPILSKNFFNSTGSTPAHKVTESHFSWIFIILLITLFVSYWLAEKTIWGLQMKFAGDKKSALQAIGVSAEKIQWQSITYGAFITGLGGAILSLFLASSYSPMMSAGRGFIALAAVIFSGWKLTKSLAICFVFGLIEALQIQMQSSFAGSTTQFWSPPDILLQLLPYLITLFALLILKEKNKAPAELK
jgi:ABC-type uncharacterized transport system permease subunit